MAQKFLSCEPLLQLGLAIAPKGSYGHSREEGPQPDF